MIGKPIWEFVEEPNSKTAVFNKLQGKIKPALSYERTFATKDGSKIRLLIKDKMLKNEKNDIIGIRTTMQDITNMKQAEQEQQKLISIIKNSNEFICVSDLDGKILYFNDSGIKLIGLQNLENFSLEPVNFTFR